MNEKTSEKINEQALMLANRLEKRFRHLKKWAKRKSIGAFRLYDRDIPEIPLVLDYYGSFAQTQDGAVSGSLYKRPYEKDENDESIWLSAMKDCIASSLKIKPENVFLKQRQKQKGLIQYEKMGHERYTKIINESDLKFKVNLSDYLDTGLFIDRRLLRLMIRNESQDKKVLNLFSYTGSFSVYAAAGGAVSTDSVDLSNTYLDWAKENFEMNGFSAEITKKNFTTNGTFGSFTNQHEYKIKDRDRKEEKVCTHRLIKDDVLEFIKNAAGAKACWDIIVVDPPAFSNSKKMTDNFDLNRDLIDLLKQCINLLSPDGKIFVSVNVKRGAPSAQELQTAFSFSSFNNLQVTDLGKNLEDEDFKGRKIPKTFLIAAKV